MERKPNIALVPMEGDLDVTSVPAVRRNIDGLIAGGCRRIILNMAGVQYVDSSGMALLFCEIRRMRSVGGLISLTNTSERVMRSLRIARLVDFAPVSGMGARPDVPELDPSVMPDWCTSLKINPRRLQETRQEVESLLASTPFTDDERFDLVLAIGEAMGNAVDHTDGSCSLVTVTRYPDRVVVEVTDCGCGYEPTAADLSAAGSALAPGAERGRGMRLMRLLTDSVSIRRRGGGMGTEVCLVKLVSPVGEKSNPSH